jgi:stage II sporulation protein P
MNFVLKNKEKITTTENKIENSEFYIKYLERELPFTNLNEEQDANENTIILKILSLQISLLGQIKESKKLSEGYSIEEENILANTEEISNEADNQNEENSKNDSKETIVLKENNINESYTNENSGVKINNQTDYDIGDIVNSSEYDITSKKVIIYHTHTCESYTATEKYSYQMTDSFRTNDLNYTVAKVGDELTTQLEKKGFSVVHNKTYHDYPSYNGSYGRSLQTLKSIFEKNSDAQIIIDLHRDAIGSSTSYAPRVQIGDETCAQVMFVIGTDSSGLEHPNWRENLKYAIEVQKKANELYPGLFRPIVLRTARFNQQLTTASSIIEVGATGNTLEECINSMKYVAEVLDAVVDK